MKPDQFQHGPPFTALSAREQVQAIQGVWNGCQIPLVIQFFDDAAQLFSQGNLINGKARISEFLKQRQLRELHCNLKMELWSFNNDRISTSFQSEWQDAIRRQWYRTEGNMQMCFAETGLIRKLSISSIDISITAEMRRLTTVNTNHGCGQCDQASPGCSDYL